MKNMVRHIYTVTLGICLSMFFSIVSFAVTGVPWFSVPDNADLYYTVLQYRDTNGANQTKTYARDSSGYINIPKPSDISYNYTPNLKFYFYTNDAGYYGITISDSNVSVIDSNPTINRGSVVWANNGYYLGSKIYSLQSSYISPTSTKINMGTTNIFHPNGVDGGTALSDADFPITFKLNVYCGQINYAGISNNPDNDTTESISAQRSSSALELTQTLYESVEDYGSALNSSLEWAAYNISTLRNNQAVGTTWNDSQGVSHTLPTYNQIEFSLVNEHVQHTLTPKAGTFLGILSRKFDELFNYFKFQFEIFFQWFYPIKDSTPQYWMVYNTDTDQSEMVNPATVTYYITWYLGQLFLMGNENTPLGDLQDHVDDIKDQFQTVETQEQSIIDSIDDSFSTFMPDLNQIGSFRALSWCSNYLQQIYVSLGAYGTVILIGLLLGVCMQFIGYFRYK